MSTLRTCNHCNGCTRKWDSTPKTRCQNCGATTVESQVKYGVFDHLDSKGNSAHTGLVVRTGVVTDSGISWPAPYTHVVPVVEYHHQSVAQKFADRENANR